ncbi:MAG: hypothetical protein FD189_1225 [Elusimicrobia bacterium]|nr:MAG: hypothetical protein FD154_1620 [Elusimicrobiota bacterium]KAF0155859.1 MAG: hypothetical protein FD189_1225 [Elusimicrobiota bacterium]
MNPKNMFRAGRKLKSLLTGKVRGPALPELGQLEPTRIFYLWEKHSLRRIELFSME